MHIIFAAAWPEPEIAKELTQHLAKQAPALVAYLGRSKPKITSSPNKHTLCTAAEHSLLLAHGYQPNGHISAGLGPLRLKYAAAHARQQEKPQPVWLAELTHMAPSRDGAALLPANQLQISSAQAQQLFENALPIARDFGFAMDNMLADSWRIYWPEQANIKLACASPELVAQSSVNNWWPQDEVARPWRQLCNALQMAWFEHPVNQQRAAAGLPAINNLWLYGGANSDSLSASSPTPIALIEPALSQAAMRQDWGHWLQIMAQLEQKYFAAKATQPTSLVLCGQERFVELSPSNGLLARFRRKDWRDWWSQA